MENQELLKGKKKQSTTLSFAPPPSTTISYEDALVQYYKLKQRYDDLIIKNKDKILKTLPIKIQRKKFHKALSCINCKKSGGTIFTNDSNTLRAVCGNSEHPCKLHIEIQRSSYKNIRDVEEKYAKNIDALKNNIIKIKLNLLFGYANEEKTVNEFNKYKNILNERSKEYQKIQAAFLRIVDDINAKAMMEDKENQLLVLIDSLKQIKKEYRDKYLVLSEEQKNNFINNMVEYYITKIKPINEEIVENKYKFNEIYLDENSKKYVLAREIYTLKDLEFVDENNIGTVVTFLK
jgi:hypothetical protein